jgi:Erv1 / Alr family
MSLQNIDPTVWGPSAWSVLHFISFHSKSSTEELRDLFKDLKVLLPCAKCRLAYTNHLSLCPFPTRRDQVSRWLYTIHDRVNRSIQSPAMNDTPPFQEVQKAWRGANGMERANRDSWRFLFILALAYPSPQEAKRRVAYREALSRWMKEVSITLWNIEPRDTSLETKTRFTQWLKGKYQAIHHRPPPASFLNPGTGCEKKCQAL